MFLHEGFHYLRSFSAASGPSTRVEKAWLGCDHQPSLTRNSNPTAPPLLCRWATNHTRPQRQTPLCVPARLNYNCWNRSLTCQKFLLKCCSVLPTLTTSAVSERTCLPAAEVSKVVSAWGGIYETADICFLKKCDLIFALALIIIWVAFLTTTWVTGRGYRYGMWRTFKVMCKRCNGYSDMKSLSISHTIICIVRSRWVFFVFRLWSADFFSAAALGFFALCGFLYLNWFHQI